MSSAGPTRSGPVRGRGRYASPPDRRWRHALARWPWVTLLLLTVLGAGVVELARPVTYQATSVLSAPGEQAGDRATSALGDPDLVVRVEREIELTPPWRGGLGLDVHPGPDAGTSTTRVEVQVLASAPDPRLAALAADTAVALVVRDHPDDGLELARAATVPAEPVRSFDPWWLLPAGGALLVALRVEGWARR
jgi:hypothetical protein